MYINAVFILYITALLISPVCLVFIALIFVGKNDRINQRYIAIRRFAVTVMITNLLYFIFFYQVLIDDPFPTSLPFRIADYILCTLVFMFWLFVIANMINPVKHRFIKPLAVTVTVSRLAVSIPMTIIFMGEYYDIAITKVRVAWSVFETVFVVITAVLIIHYTICCLAESIVKLRGIYVLICSALLTIWSISQGIVDLGLFASKYGVSAWSMDVPDLTGATMFLVMLATCIYAYREDFSKLFPGRAKESMNSSGNIEESIEEEKETRIKLDLIAEEHKLTVRERDVLGFMYAGDTNPEIGEKLFISKNTVKKHIHNIFEKLDAKSRMEVVHIVNAKKIS